VLLLTNDESSHLVYQNDVRADCRWLKTPGIAARFVVQISAAGRTARARSCSTGKGVASGAMDKVFSPGFP
jgi:hypothetical protein